MESQQRAAILSGLRIHSQRVLVDGQLADATVTVESGVIAAIEHGRSSTGRCPPDHELGGLLLLPGVVDIHGDAFERQWMPRPNVFFPLEVALAETDRQLIANGITTAYHGLTVSWEPGLRSIEHGRQMVEALMALRPRLRCDTRLHLRYEICSIDEAPELLRWVHEGKVGLIGFNDHLEMIRAHLDKESKAGKYAERSGLSIGQFRALLERTSARRPDVEPITRRIAEAALARGVALASHDDETPAMRDYYARLGSSICEFPVDETTARAARDAGAEVVLGGPNVVRGGSHANRLSAREAIAKGLATVLASDYYYPSLLHAVFVLVRLGGGTVPALWPLVSGNPARAAGLSDRGGISPRLRADLVAVDDSHPELPEVAFVWVAGELALSSGSRAAARPALTRA